MHDHAAAQRAYYRRNRARVRSSYASRLSSFASRSNRRAAAQGVPGRLTSAGLRRVYGPCAYCDGPATGWDHVVPMCQGGPNVIENLVPSCIRCNRAKARRTPAQWGRWLLPDQIGPVDVAAERAAA